ncbi:MAG TPA: branched-chain amino acid ABC transporter permease [Burkholderiaceae bacterium]|nr:branched-chain amino acid ABC transporter permease [Burkholderiaceae bacterium]
MSAIPPVLEAPQAAGSVPADARRFRPHLIITLVVLALSVTLLAKGYQLFQATMVVSYAIALLGLNLLTGYNGQISLGHGAFYAVGAYATAILLDRYGVPYWLCVPISGFTALVVGYLFGRPALRLEGLYLALATFALGIAAPQLLKSRYFEPWTGGSSGIVLTKPEAPFGIPLDADQWFYLFSLAVGLLMLLIARNLVTGGSGRAMRAMRDHPLAAEAIGVPGSHCKSVTFGISAGFTGVAGSLFAVAVQFVSPDTFGMFLSISLLVGIVVGGVGTLWGALYGAVFIMFVPDLAEKVSKAAPWLVYGVVLIVFVYLLPGGFARLLRRRA